MYIQNNNNNSNTFIFQNAIILLNNDVIDSRIDRLQAQILLRKRTDIRKLLFLRPYLHQLLWFHL